MSGEKLHPDLDQLLMVILPSAGVVARKGEIG
jgi:hypothetical protein